MSLNTQSSQKSVQYDINKSIFFKHYLPLLAEDSWFIDGVK